MNLEEETIQYIHENWVTQQMVNQISNHPLKDKEYDFLFLLGHAQNQNGVQVEDWKMFQVVRILFQVELTVMLRLKKLIQFNKFMEVYLLGYQTFSKFLRKMCKLQVLGIFKPHLILSFTK